jgi:membrane fusion protein, multidrug efflux system
VRFSVAEREFPQVQRYAGRGALPVRAIHTDGVATAIAGTLSFVDNGVDSTTGTVTLKGQFENGDRQLWPGQFVRVELELFSEPNAVQVPSQSVLTGQDGTFVFSLDDKGAAVMRPVTAGRIVGDRTVIEKGLDAGEQVVTDGQAKLAPGSKVSIKGEAAPAAAPKGGGTP